MSRRKGTPCACECNPCAGKNYVRAVNNVSPNPNGDLELRAGNGIAISQSGDNQITITNDAIASSFVAGDNIEINPSGDNLEIRVTNDISVNDIDAAGDVNISGDVDISGDTNIGGTLNIAGDIIQQGAAYETHAEKVYTTNDYIYMRDGAVGGLAAGDFSGFQVIKYDGTNDGRLVIDKDGVARVGDVGDEQPLLTRSESGQLNNGDLLQWNGTSQKAVSAGVNTSQIVRGSGNIGNDTKPIKVVNGVATAVTNDLVSTQGNQDIYGQKIFHSPVRIQDSNVFIDMSKFYVSASHRGGDVYTGVDLNNYGGIRLVYDQTTSSISLQIIKVVNGQFSGSEIAHL